MKFNANAPAGIVYGTCNSRVATSTNTTLSAPGATIDGVTMANGERVLLYGQTTGSQNGIWIFNGSGSPMTRSTDTISNGMLVTISEGSQPNKTFILTTTGAIIVDSTTLTFKKTTNIMSYVLTQLGVT